MWWISSELRAMVSGGLIIFFNNLIIKDSFEVLAPLLCGDRQASLLFSVKPSNFSFPTSLLAVSSTVARFCAWGCKVILPFSINVLNWPSKSLVLFCQLRQAIFLYMFTVSTKTWSLWRLTSIWHCPSHIFFARVEEIGGIVACGLLCS